MCCSTHMAPNFTDFPFPKDLMARFVQQNNGQSHCLWHSSLRHVEHLPLPCKCSTSCPTTSVFQLTLCCDTGYFPVVLETLPEGTCVHAHCPVFQVGRHAKHQSFFAHSWYMLCTLKLCRESLPYVCLCMKYLVFADHSRGRLCPFMYIPGDNSDHALVSSCK